VFNVILLEPEIPGNTGNIIRLCANTGSRLHLVEPLGFGLTQPQLRRAGLDYADLAQLSVHPSLDACLQALGSARRYAIETGGERPYSDVQFRSGDALLFGPESRGMSTAALGLVAPENILRIPMRPNNRSLNLSNAVALVVYEAWRQQRFR
jgi:tRNA (cytidine/uridine-2'-O-)-methyltransferase